MAVLHRHVSAQAAVGAARHDDGDLHAERDDGLDDADSGLGMAAHGSPGVRQHRVGADADLPLAVVTELGALPDAGAPDRRHSIGRASCRDRVWQYRWIPGVAVTYKKKRTHSRKK